MTFTVLKMDQRSPEWIAVRLGRLTASRAADMLSTIKHGEAASRRNLRVQLVLERITGRSHERGFQSQAMQHGIDREAEARGAYEAMAGHLLQNTGFVSASDLMVGCSLDGHVGDFEGLIEIKCPLSATHLDYLKTGVVPGEYLKQITHGLWITGAQWCDWMSYDPAFPEPLRAKLVRVTRDEAEIAAYEQAALAFLAEVETECRAVSTMTDLGRVLHESGVA